MKIRSEKHRRFVASRPCIITGRQGEGVQSHHLLRAGGKGLGTKACDSLCVPLYYMTHDALHRMGDEIAFFANHGLDYEYVKTIAKFLALASPCSKIRNLTFNNKEVI